VHNRALVTFMLINVCSLNGFCNKYTIQLISFRLFVCFFLSFLFYYHVFFILSFFLSSFRAVIAQSV
jgi:hypothetical protein